MLSTLSVNLLVVLSVQSYFVLHSLKKKIIILHLETYISYIHFFDVYFSSNFLLCKDDIFSSPMNDVRPCFFMGCFLNWWNRGWLTIYFNYLQLIYS